MKRFWLVFAAFVALAAAVELAAWWRRLVAADEAFIRKLHDRWSREETRPSDESSQVTAVP